MKSFLQTLKTGFATFSMFFGAGNILFPLSLGQATQDMGPIAIIGLLLSAVAIPISGLVAMTWYDGDYQRFFARLGNIPGMLTALVIMLLLGPLGSTPRCVALSFSTLKVSLPALSSFWFSLAACVIIYLCTVKRRRLMDMLGFILTPWLLFTLAIIIFAGIWGAPPTGVSEMSAGAAFSLGLTEGYYTMDLLAAFFFSSVIVRGVRRDLETASPELVRRRTLQAGFIGAGLLALVYVSFCFVAAHHTSHIEGLSDDRLLGALTLHLLGPYAGIIASSTVSLACLTTAIALTSVFADFLSRYVLQNKISYHTALLASLIVTFFVANVELGAIMAFLKPILEVLYPILIVLTAYSLVKRPVNITVVQ
ncbi:MAG: branched-chain amino acid transport system II carrier protein [Chlamydiales bacterium]|nr:branched-chain amino acid transport system II carrier protein [Chlamydiales bacterium]